MIYNVYKTYKIYKIYSISLSFSLSLSLSIYTADFRNIVAVVAKFWILVLNNKIGRPRKTLGDHGRPREYRRQRESRQQRPVRPHKCWSETQNKVL